MNCLQALRSRAWMCHIRMLFVTLLEKNWLLTCFPKRSGKRPTLFICHRCLRYCACSFWCRLCISFRGSMLKFQLGLSFYGYCGNQRKRLIFLILPSMCKLFLHEWIICLMTIILGRQTYKLKELPITVVALTNHLVPYTLFRCSKILPDLVLYMDQSHLASDSTVIQVTGQCSRVQKRETRRLRRFQSSSSWLHAMSCVRSALIFKLALLFQNDSVPVHLVLMSELGWMRAVLQLWPESFVYFINEH